MAKAFFTAEWFPYYFERFERSDRVAVMSLSEEGAYHRAIRLAWKYGSVPADPKQLAAKIQKRCSERIALVVLEMFEPMPDNPRQMIHPTVEEIREEQERKYLNRVKGGKASAASRGNKDTSSITEQGSNNTSTHNRDKREESREEEEEKKKKEKRTPQAASPKGTRLPEPFNLTKEMRNYAATKRPNIDVLEETEKFVNHWRAKTGRDATKLDWKATWRNWILNAKGTNGTNRQNNGSKPTNRDQIERTKRSLEKFPTEAELAALAREGHGDAERPK